MEIFLLSEMKWPGEDPNLINLGSQQTAHGHNPPRTQDDAMIGYVFQRGAGDQPEFPPNSVPLPGKLPARWALGTDELVPQQHQEQHPNPEQMIFMNNEMAMMTQHHPGLPLPPHMQPRPVSNHSSSGVLTTSFT
ncbi:hypothetical protein RUM44_003983 [Polyplax serrata]|uniref:Uncharacterized protein n=1 Tax=Polyplax serrata TaxID=468196 RepID=A0ABR1B1I6_POLSC